MDQSWSDFIYAGGQKVARADNYDERLHTTGTCTSTCIVTWQLPAAGGYQLRSGDTLRWRQYEAAASGGLDITFQDGTQTAWQLNDSTGQSVQGMTTPQSQWVYRSADLSGFTGHGPIQNYYLFTDSTTPLGSWHVWYADISIVSTDGTVTPISNRQPGATPAFYYNYNNAATNLTATAEHAYIGSAYSPTTTTFYLSDHLGSARMEFAGAGWPVWSGDFDPYGQEIQPQTTVNNYKFTGYERDAESGLDHAGARYYASSMARFLRPDPSGLSYANPYNPQSLNLYSYVMNSPLSYIDPSGLDCVYLNDAGSGVDANGGIDHDSNSGECGRSGGYWAPGYVPDPNYVNIDQDSGLAIIDSFQDGSELTSIANCADCPGLNPNGTPLGFFTATSGYAIDLLQSYAQSGPLSLLPTPPSHSFFDSGGSLDLLLAKIPTYVGCVLSPQNTMDTRDAINTVAGGKARVQGPIRTAVALESRLCQTTTKIVRTGGLPRRQVGRVLRQRIVATKRRTAVPWPLNILWVLVNAFKGADEETYRHCAARKVTRTCG